MKILYLSKDKLPDDRIERTMISGKRGTHTISYAGTEINGLALNIKSYENFYHLPFNSFVLAGEPYNWLVLKKRMKKIIENSKPDLLHAHNIVAAKLASEFSIPFIYDDHEYYSKKLSAVVKPYRIHEKYIQWLWSDWENTILEKADSVITTSENIAIEHKKRTNRVYVTPNFPLEIEVMNLKINKPKDGILSSVYIGNDLSKKQRGTPRNIEGILELFNKNNIGILNVLGDKNLSIDKNVISLGALTHTKMFEELTKHHIGLLPQKKHWFHKYACPNKAFEYAHAGLLVLSISDYINVKKYLGKYCETFEDNAELLEMLKYKSNNINEIVDLSNDIKNYAYKNLTWDKKSEPTILKAYSKI